MNHDKFLSIGAMLAVMALDASNVRAANAKPAAETPLTKAGQKLLGKYSEQLKALQAEPAKDLPKMDEQQKAALQKARDAVKTAEAAAGKAQQPRNNIQTAKALVDHAKGKWIGDAEKNTAKAQAALKERQEALDKVQADCSQAELERAARTSVAQQARGGGDAGLGNELARRDAKDASDDAGKARGGQARDARERGRRERVGESGLQVS